MQNITLIPLNFNKICRVCLSESENMTPIFSELFEQNVNQDTPFIYEVLLSISSIKIDVNDGLPNMLCTGCKKNARYAYNFQKQCNRSQAILDACILNAQQLNKSVSSSEQVDESSTTEIHEESKLLHDIAISYKNQKEESNKSDKIDDHVLETDSNVDELFINIPKQEILSDNEANNEIIGNKLKNRRLSRIRKDKKLFNDNLMSYYRKIHNGRTVFGCNICNQSYKNSEGLVIHLRTHSRERPYVCGKCTKSFDSFYSLRFHQKSHSDEQPHVCKVCGKRYKQSGSLTAHMRVHTGLRPFLCSVCGRGFRQSPDLTYHMRTHTKEKPYMCNICGKTMAMQCHLVQHIRTHTGERPFKCTQCDKSFPSSTRLKRHIIIHTDLKPFTCEVCGKSFNRKSTLRVHAKIHTDERPYVCSVCQKRFIQAHALRSHILTHTSENNSDNQFVKIESIQKN